MGSGKNTQLLSERDPVIVYTDGSCNNNKTSGRYGGFGVVLLWEDHEKHHWEGFKGTTNNQMELMGLIWALETITPGYRIEIISDSKYCVEPINQRWLFSWDLDSRKNGWLWRRFLKAYQLHHPELLTFKWTRGHSNNKYNDIADGLAGKGYKSKSDNILSILSK